MDDEYELMPAVELEKLRQEVAALKAGPSLGAGPDTAALQQSMNNLTAAINRLLKVFSSIDEELIKQAQSSGTSADYTEQLAEIKDQNEQIAEGVVAVAEMVKDVKSAQEAQPSIAPEQPPASLPASDPSSQASPEPIAPAQPQMPPVTDQLSQATQQQAADWAQSPSEQAPSSQTPGDFPPLSDVPVEPLPMSNDQNLSSQVPVDPFNPGPPMQAPLASEPQQATLPAQGMPQAPAEEKKKGVFGMFKK